MHLPKAVCGLGVLLASLAFAQSVDKSVEALKVIGDFADRLCQTVPLDTRSENLQLSGNAKAELEGIIKKLANLGISGAAKYESSSSQNVLQKDLAEVLKESRDCRLEIRHDLKSKFQIGSSVNNRPSPTAAGGNLLSGEHRPRGHAPWSSSLVTRTGVARIWKPDSAVTGRVDMTCAEGRWSARLFEMSNGVVYNCVGDMEGGRLRNATCNASGPPVIDVSGLFANTVTKPLAEQPNNAMQPTAASELAVALVATLLGGG